MEYYLGLVLCEDILHPLTIANIGSEVSLDLLTNAGENVIVLRGIGVQPHPNDLGTQFVQPDAEPRALETSMTSDQDTLSKESTVKDVYHR